VDGPLDFTTLKKRLNVADGALGLHLRTLEDAGYIAPQKRFIGRRPRTTYRLTPAGRKALLNYVQSMRALLDAVDS
jgi:DNA-binding PadR family transcriptional regulator